MGIFGDRSDSIILLSFTLVFGIIIIALVIFIIYYIFFRGK